MMSYSTIFSGAGPTQSSSASSPASTEDSSPSKLASVISDILNKLPRIDPQLLTFEESYLYSTSVGSYGDVRKAHLSDGMASSGSIPVAVKVLRIAETTNIKTLKRRFAREASMLSKIKHPNVLELVGVHYAPQELRAWIICPWMPKGDAAHFVRKNEPSAIEILTLLKDAASALSYLHSQDPPLRHGDVKAANLLVSNENRGKLSDFGLAGLLGDPVFSVLESDLKGTFRWSSPEVLNDLRGVEADVWAWGWVAWELFTGQHPFPDILGVAKVFHRLLSESGPVYPELSESDIPFVELRDLMQRCWDRDVKTRVRAEDCIPVMQGLIDSLVKASSDPNQAHNPPSPEDADSGYGTSVCDHRPPEEPSTPEDISQADTPYSTPYDRNDPPSWRDALKSVLRLTRRLCCCGGARKRKPRGRRRDSGDDDDNNDDYDSRSYPLLEVDPESLNHDSDYPPARKYNTGAVKARLLGRSSYFALKTLSSRTDANVSPETQATVARRVRSMKAIHDPRLLSPLGLTTVDGVLHLVSPWNVEGNLRQHLLQNPSPDARGEILKGIADALLALHNRDRVHSGLKLENVLIGDDGVPILAESGIPQLIEDLRLGTYGHADDVRLLAPEVLAGGPFTAASDVYAFACVGLEVITGKRPFDGYDQPGEVILALNRGEYPSNGLSELSPTSPLRSLLMRCWDRQPSKRPGMSEVFQTLLDLGAESRIVPFVPERLIEETSEGILDRTTGHSEAEESGQLCHDADSLVSGAWTEDDVHPPGVIDRGKCRNDANRRLHLQPVPDGSPGLYCKSAADQDVYALPGGGAIVLTTPDPCHDAVSLVETMGAPWFGSDRRVMDYLGDIQVSKRGQQRPAVSAKIVPKKADKNGHWHATNEKTFLDSLQFGSSLRNLRISFLIGSLRINMGPLRSISPSIIGSELSWYPKWTRVFDPPLAEDVASGFAYLRKQEVYSKSITAAQVFLRSGPGRPIAVLSAVALPRPLEITSLGPEEVYSIEDTSSRHLDAPPWAPETDTWACNCLAMQSDEDLLSCANITKTDFASEAMPLAAVRDGPSSQSSQYIARHKPYFRTNKKLSTTETPFDYPPTGHYDPRRHQGPSGVHGDESSFGGDGSTHDLGTKPETKRRGDIGLLDKQKSFGMELLTTAREPESRGLDSGSSDPDGTIVVLVYLPPDNIQGLLRLLTTYDFHKQNKEFPVLYSACPKFERDGVGREALHIWMDPPPDLESSLAEGFSLVTTSGCGRWPHLLWHDWPSGPSSAAVNREHGELQVKLNDPTRNVGQLSETEFIGLCLVEYQGLPTFTSPIKATGGPGFHERDLLLGGAASQNTPSHLQRHRQVRHQLQQSPIREPPWPVEVVEIDDFAPALRHQGKETDSHFDSIPPADTCAQLEKYPTHIIPLRQEHGDVKLVLKPYTSIKFPHNQRLGNPTPKLAHPDKAEICHGNMNMNNSMNYVFNTHDSYPCP